MSGSGEGGGAAFLLGWLGAKDGRWFWLGLGRVAGVGPLAMLASAEAVVQQPLDR